jgi:cytochrome c peroxidase
METFILRKVAVVALLSVAAACTQKTATAPARPIGTPIEIKPPLGLPPLPVSPDNPPTAETVALGRKLFYDPRLSAGDELSCASCHNPLLGFSDGRRVSVGVDGHTGQRNAPTVVNAVYNRLQFWDGRAASLEDQAAGPIANPIEMNQKHDACAARIDGDAAYRAEFARAFGPGPVTMDKIQKALAAFERTLVSGNSPFDRYFYGGDNTALSPAAIRGLEIFRDPQKGNCAVCHTIGEKYATFTDGNFHNIGIAVASAGTLSDEGRYTQTKAEADHGRFRTPTLRNIALTAPYMHTGGFRTLRAVVDFYAGGGNSNPWLDKEMKPLSLTRQDREDLVAFLESLTGEMPPDIGPPPRTR